MSSTRRTNVYTGTLPSGDNVLNAEITGSVTDIRSMDMVSYQYVWQGSHATGTFTAVSGIVAGVTASISGVGITAQTFVSITGANSGSNWNTGSSLADAATNLATAINATIPLTASAVVSGAVVTVTSVSVGSGQNYFLSSSSGSLVAAGLSGGGWPSGTLTVETSHDYQAIPGQGGRVINAGNWDACSGVAAIAVSGSASGHATTNIGFLAAPYVRPHWVPASGSSGSITAVVSAKGS